MFGMTEVKSEFVNDDDRDQNQIELPPGFRFHPTDEELITDYLSNKAVDSNFTAVAIGEVDMNRVEPWELPWLAKLGEKEWYFFCIRDKKYPTGLRTNRATAAGYWKATGKDRAIFRGKTLVGMKKTLVFYKGRAPKGVKSNWVTHEYRLDGDKIPKSAKNDWVISRVFQKTTGGKKIHISGMRRMDREGNVMNASTMPPLIESPKLEHEHVHCFSRATVTPQKTQEEMTTSFNDLIFPSSSNPVDSSFQAEMGFNFPDFYSSQGFYSFDEL